MPINDILDRLEDAERRWAGQQFLAPVVPGRPIAVRIAGVVCKMRTVKDMSRGYAGWAVLEAITASSARFLRGARLAEREAYLSLFPQVRLILVQRSSLAGMTSPPWLALPAQASDARLQLAGLAAVQLPEEGLERFDTIVARYDGRLFWYDRREAGRDPSIATFLRGSLARRGPNHLPPDAGALRKRGLSAEERKAYTCARDVLVRASREAVEERLADALEHAHANLQSYAEHGDVCAVTYEVDGHVYTSTIRRDDLTVTTSGICLSGQDHHFDLASLVGVMREARERGRFDED